MESSDKSKNSTENFRLKNIVKSKLGKYILTWVLIIAILPSLTISYIEYQITSESIREEAEYYLKETSELIGSRILRFFAERKMDLQLKAGSKKNTAILKSFLEKYEKSGMGLKEFTQSYEWASTSQNKCEDFRIFSDKVGYHDIFLMDLSGNIIYTVMQEEDLGTNILTGEFSETKFSKAVKTCLNTGQLTFSDFEFYTPTNEFAGFIVDLLVDERGVKQGFMAFQFAQDEIDNIVNSKSKNFEFFDSYLIGNDLKMRSNSALDSESSMLREIVNTEQSREWKKRYVNSQTKLDPGKDNYYITEYIGRKGYEVIGTHKNLTIAGTSVGIIIEVKKSEVFAPLNNMRIIVVLGVTFFSTVVIFLTISFTKKIVSPISQITEWGKKLAIGEVYEKKITAPDNEIGKLVDIFESIADSNKTIASQADNIAKGEFQFVVTPRSENDSLGNSLKAMTESLQSVSEAVENVAEGNLNVSIIEKSENDILSMSINKMTANLRETIENSRQLISNLNSLPTPVYTIDRTFNLTYVNPKGAQLFNMKPENLIGLKCYDVFRSDDCKGGDCTAGKAMDGNRVVSHESNLKLADRDMPINSSASPILDVDKNIIGAIVYVMDITEAKELLEDNQLQLWFSNGLSEVSKIVREASDVNETADEVCRFLAEYLDCQILSFYVVENLEASDEKRLLLAGGYAFDKRNQVQVIEFGEGITGQAAVEKRIISLHDVPEDYTSVNSSLISTKPKSIAAAPLMFGEDVIGVLEVGSISHLNDTKITFIGKLIYMLGISLNTLISNLKVQELLRKTESQQEKLQISNEELAERTRQLDDKNKAIEDKNKSLVEATEELKRNAEKLEVTSRYKSEFLANMSHELRTPLNSLLLLAQNLSKNRTGNLTEKQIKNAQIIYKGGKDLLNMINEILDLSKIESGKMDVFVESIDIETLKTDVSDVFDHLVEKKGLKFNIDIKEGVPQIIRSDRQKLFQIIKNLISNALKFTHQGGIDVTIFTLAKDEKPVLPHLLPESTLGFAVKDSGIGIPEDKLLEVFEAFQQADGSTSRQYGGTGLGLSISREMAKLLGGEITLESKVGQGSTFTLYVNASLTDKIADFDEKTDDSAVVKKPLTTLKKEQAAKAQDFHIKDDRNDFSKEDLVIVAIEDDEKYAEILGTLCKESGFKFIHSGNGRIGLDLLREIKPDGIFLDINLPEMDGLQILEEVKKDARLRYIPLYLMSVNEKPAEIMKKGITGFLAKPVDSQELEKAIAKIKSVYKNGGNKLLILQNEEEMLSINEAIGNSNVELKSANTGKAGFEYLKNEEFDAVVVDWDLPDISGFEFLKEMNKTNEFLPVLIYTDHKIEEKDQEIVNALASRFVNKTNALHKNLVDELSFFINLAADNSKNEPESAPTDDVELKSKTVLIVDDDVRNLYSLEEELTEMEMNVLKATDGKISIETLKNNSDIDIVLMDIMMPVMNGYEAMEEIRKTEEIKSVPIIAVTAKAMKEDREKCIEAGADDYISKPVDVEELTELMKKWIKK